MFHVTNNVVVLFITTAVNLVAAVVSWQRQNTKSGVYFALGMMGVTFLTMAVGFGYAAQWISIKIAIAKFEYLAYNVAFTFFALFALSYAGYEEGLNKLPVKIFFYALPISNIVLAWTNDWHKWLWTNYAFSGMSGDTLVFEHGPGYLWTSLTGCLMILFIIVPLWHASRKGMEFSRRQARLLFFTSLIPIIGYLSYIFDSPEFYGVDLTSITFSISSLLFSLALYGTRLLDLVPIARDTVIAGLSDGLIVLDIQGRIIDLNQVAAAIIQGTVESLVGKNFSDVFLQIPAIQLELLDEEIRTELDVHCGDKRFFDTLISPLRDSNRLVVGHLIILRDITARKQAEESLERRYLEIRALNQDLQKTQSQLVDQQRTLAALEERQRLARDLHDSVNQSIHSMVLFADTLAAALEKNNIERARAIMDKLRENANQSLRETRLMLYQLEEPSRERSVDLARDIEDRLAMVERRSGVQTQLIQDGSIEYCPPEWRENLFWIVVEALNNSLKHSRATNLQVVLRSRDHRFELDVVDNGKGFNPSQTDVGGLGLKNLRARADLLGGTLKIESEPSKGTSVYFSAEIKAK